jgi:hypothetical protein
MKIRKFLIFMLLAWSSKNIIRRPLNQGGWDGRGCSKHRTMEETDHLEDIGVNRRIILIWIMRKKDVRVWMEFKWLRIASSGRFL